MILDVAFTCYGISNEFVALEIHQFINVVFACERAFILFCLVLPNPGSQFGSNSYVKNFIVSVCEDLNPGCVHDSTYNDWE